MNALVVGRLWFKSSCRLLVTFLKNIGVKCQETLPAGSEIFDGTSIIFLKRLNPCFMIFASTRIALIVITFYPENGTHFQGEDVSLTQF